MSQDYLHKHFRYIIYRRVLKGETNDRRICINISTHVILYWVIIRNRKICIKRGDSFNEPRIRVKLYVAGQVSSQKK